MQLLLAALAFVVIGFAASANPIGNITEITGSPGNIERSGNLLEAAVNTSLANMDVIVTQNGSAKLRFVDNTKISITEQSRLVIDEYVYDPRQGDNSKVTLRVGMGTVRYASGQIAKINQQKVDLQTPTASIAVRGTDFFMTVAESGESFVVLVPSCDQAGVCRTGKIQVSNPAGMVELDQPFTATTVTNAHTPPTPPSRIQVSESNINNLMIVVPPPGLKGLAKSSASGSQEANQDALVVSSKPVHNPNTSDVPSQLIMKESVVNKSTAVPIVVETTATGATTASRATPGYGQSFVRFLDGSTGNVTISHNGDNATTQVGTVGGNTFIIRPSP
jgi:hypothetical protein